MARGGRRRRKRGGGKGPRPEGAAQPQPTGGDAARRRRRRRGRGGGGITERSVIEAMSSRPKTLQTLPPDGQVLEELISDLQNEYGTPTTPQEYRLLIKVPVPAGTPEGEATASDSIRLDPVDDEETPDGEPRRKRRRRRRGRRRRPEGGIAGEAMPEGSEDGTDEADEMEEFMHGPVEVSDPATSGTISVDVEDVGEEIQADQGPLPGV